MKDSLGTHSTSLAVKDIQTSKSFYEKLGFSALPDLGSVEEKWMIMEKEGVKIGLFQDMFEENIITFNPQNARSIYKQLKDQDVSFLMESPTVQDKKGPCHFCITDPDGNQILFDQHNE
ncbi:MAG: VOC family protein [Cyanothece sp. SIO1E1]|nr:VOC family protein [Cyanothece sp. SIO1E1]